MARMVLAIHEPIGRNRGLLPPEGSVVVGRDPAANIRINDTQVSRGHVELTRVGSRG
jgi:pSer/pThr/pTyr-binding forkhead associated (FHA) protein